MNIEAELKNPWVKYSVFGVIGIGLIYIVYTHMGVSSAATAQTDSNQVDPGLVALQQQQNAIQASAAQATSNQQYNLTLDAQQSSEALAMATLQYDTQTQQQANQIKGTLDLATLQSTEQISLANINQQNINASLASTALLQKQSLDATTTLAQITANTQTHISDNQTSVAINQSNNASDSAQNGQDDALYGGIAAAGIAAIAFF